MTKEIQHAEVTIQVAMSLEKELENNERMRVIEEGVKTILSGGDTLEFRRISGLTKLHHTETEAEAAKRYMAEQEMKAEKAQQDRLERHWDNNGHF